jgi:hypothetical protein
LGRLHWWWNLRRQRLSRQRSLLASWSLEQLLGHIRLVNTEDFCTSVLRRELGAELEHLVLLYDTASKQPVFTTALRLDVLINPTVHGLNSRAQMCRRSIANAKLDHGM